MKLADIALATEKDLRTFAWLQVLFFALMSVLLFRRGVAIEILVLLLLVSFGIGVIGGTRPSLIRPVYTIWMLVVFPIGWTVSHLLLAIVYYTVVTPIGLWRTRVAGDPLQRNLDPTALTYWEDRNPEKKPESYFRQF